MKALLNEFRMLVTEWLLGVIISLCPNNIDGHILVVVIRNYFQFKVKQK